MITVMLCNRLTTATVPTMGPTEGSPNGFYSDAVNTKARLLKL